VLKQREREAQEAEEARRRRVVVSFDLLGRKVLLDETAADGEGGQANAAALQAQLDAARAVAEARAAAAATEAQAAQGGGGAAPTALAAVEERLRDLRITVAPSFASRHLVFLPQQAQQQARQPAQAQREGQHAAGAPQAEVPQQAGARQRQRQQQQQQPRQPQGRQARKSRISRLQHDGEHKPPEGVAFVYGTAADSGTAAFLTAEPAMLAPPPLFGALQIRLTLHWLQPATLSWPTCEARHIELS
jgi:FtsZ-interacting cell division protein ZipA